MTRGSGSGSRGGRRGRGSSQPQRGSMNSFFAIELEDVDSLTQPPPPVGAAPPAQPQRPTVVSAPTSSSTQSGPLRPLSTPTSLPTLPDLPSGPLIPPPTLAPVTASPSNGDLPAASIRFSPPTSGPHTGAAAPPLCPSSHSEALSRPPTPPLSPTGPLVDSESDDEDEKDYDPAEQLHQTTGLLHHYVTLLHQLRDQYVLRQNAGHVNRSMPYPISAVMALLNILTLILMVGDVPAAAFCFERGWQTDVEYNPAVGCLNGLLAGAAVNFLTIENVGSRDAPHWILVIYHRLSAGVWVVDPSRPDDHDYPDDVCEKIEAIGLSFARLARRRGVRAEDPSEPFSRVDVPQRREAGTYGWWLLVYACLIAAGLWEPDQRFTEAAGGILDAETEWLSLLGFDWLQFVNVNLEHIPRSLSGLIRMAVEAAGNRNRPPSPLPLRPAPQWIQIDIRRRPRRRDGVPSGVFSFDPATLDFATLRNEAAFPAAEPIHWRLYWVVRRVAAKLYSAMAAGNTEMRDEALTYQFTRMRKNLHLTGNDVERVFAVVSAITRNPAFRLLYEDGLYERFSVTVLNASPLDLPVWNGELMNLFVDRVQRLLASTPRASVTTWDDVVPILRGLFRDEGILWPLGVRDDARGGPRALILEVGRLQAEIADLKAQLMRREVNADLLQPPPRTMSDNQSLFGYHDDTSRSSWSSWQISINTQALKSWTEEKEGMEEEKEERKEGEMEEREEGEDANRREAKKRARKD